MSSCVCTWKWMDGRPPYGSADGFSVAVKAGAETVFSRFDFVRFEVDFALSVRGERVMDACVQYVPEQMFSGPCFSFTGETVALEYGIVSDYKLYVSVCGYSTSAELTHARVVRSVQTGRALRATAFCGQTIRVLRI